MAVLSLLVVAWQLYQPVVHRPFDYVDFPQYLPVLKAHETFIPRFLALTELQTQAGRWSPITIALLAAQWSWFGWQTVGWQLVRFALLGAGTALAYGLYRRLSLTVFGSFAAASLLILTPPAITGWTRLSTGSQSECCFC
jgi:hypothetical protein